MAKIIGPMHSDNAMGLYGGSRNGVVYSRWNRVSYTRALAIDPADPHTLDQLHMRATMGCLSEMWADASPAEQAYWRTRARRAGISTWNAFCSYNLRQIGLSYLPQMTVCKAHHMGGTPPTDLAATVVANCVRITWTDAALAFTTGICMGTAGGFDPCSLNLVHLSLADPGAGRLVTIVIAPGSYYIKALSGSADGGVSAATASVGPVVIT
jgi:hypothetical protein